MMAFRFRFDRMERIDAPVSPSLPDAAALRPTCILEFVR